MIATKKLATSIHVPYQRINEIVNKRRGITPSTALRLARYFGMSEDFWMIEHRLLPILKQRLRETPAVVLLGPRQVGKTTLALALGEREGAIYLDLESEQDRARLTEPELYLADHLGRLVILDEIHRAPGLFPVLRGLIDRARRAGKSDSLYLLLGSASLDLLKQSGETLAGRVSYLELSPFDVLEAGGKEAAFTQDRLWLRGGFPESFLAQDKLQSMRWWGQAGKGSSLKTCLRFHPKGRRGIFTAPEAGRRSTFY